MASTGKEEVSFFFFLIINVRVSINFYLFYKQFRIGRSAVYKTLVVPYSSMSVDGNISGNRIESKLSFPLAVKFGACSTAENLAVQYLPFFFFFFLSFYGRTK